MSNPFPDFTPLAFPPANLRCAEQDGKWMVHDASRKKWLVLTPEEWVRQHALHYLIHHLGYPKTLVKSEGGQKVNGMTRRFDVLAHDREARPLLLMECKAPRVKITQNTFEQIGAYNLSQQAPLLVVTNGLEHYCCRVDFVARKYHWLPQIPPFKEAVS